MILIHNAITLVLLITHFLGDYHFQSEKLSEAKRKSHAALARHLAIHGLLLFISWLLTWQSNMILLFSAVWHCSWCRRYDWEFRTNFISYIPVIKCPIFHRLNLYCEVYCPL